MWPPPWPGALGRVRGAELAPEPADGQRKRMFALSKLLKRGRPSSS